MPSFSSSCYRPRHAQSTSNGRNVFDATKSNLSDIIVPEIGSTLYETIRTDDGTFIADMPTSNRNEERLCPESAPVQEIFHSNTYSIPHRWRSRSDSSSSRRGSSPRLRREAEGVPMPDDDKVLRDRQQPTTTDDADALKQLGGAYNRGPGGYYRDVFRTMENYAAQRENVSKLPPEPPRHSEPPALLLYDATDVKNESVPAEQANVGSDDEDPNTRVESIVESRKRKAPRIPISGTRDTRRARLEQTASLGVPDFQDQNIPTHSGCEVLGADELAALRCFLRSPIMFFTKQYIRVSPNVSESWLYTVIYIYSVVAGQNLGFEDLERNFYGVPVINRRVNDVENNERALDSKQEIFVQNDIIKITRSTVFRNLHPAEQTSVNERRTYSGLCPAEITNDTERNIYGNLSTRPNSTLNITSLYGEQRLSNGNIRTNEHLIITISDREEPRATIQLEEHLEGMRKEPQNYGPPVAYSEHVLAGPRRFEIKRDVEINPPEGLNELFLAEKPQICHYTIMKTYGPCLMPFGRRVAHDRFEAEESSVSSSSEKHSQLVVARPISQSSPSFGAAARVVGTKHEAEAAHPSASEEELESHLPVATIKTSVISKDDSSPQSQHRSRFSRFKEQKYKDKSLERAAESGPSAAAEEGEVHLPVAAIKTSIISKDDSSSKSEQRSRFSRFGKKASDQSLQGSRKHSSTSSHWQSEGLSMAPSFSDEQSSFRTHSSQTSADLGELSKGLNDFRPLRTSTPIKRRFEKDSNENEKYYMEERRKVSRTENTGTGTHIRSTLDCDITLNSTRQVAFTTIPIEIEGLLNGVPWRTTIRLRVKHDANEKPTFTPNQLSLNDMILWRNEQTKKEQSTNEQTNVKKQ